jgi:hypothetical protein
MIRIVSRCPYCSDGVIALDDDIPDVVFNPDRVGGVSCPHLALASIRLAAYAPTRRRVRPAGPTPRGRLVARRSGWWIWAHGRGLHRRGFDRQLDILMEKLDSFARDGEPFDVSPFEIRYRAVGGSWREREERSCASGHFLLPRPGETPLNAFLNGWGIYGPNPAAFVRTTLDGVGSLTDRLAELDRSAL